MGITKAEVALTVAGMRWSVGDSRIVVARRLDAHSITG
jgi:hypothetical protein